MRRLAHLVLLISIIAAVRACGGLVVAEDRFSVHAQWIGDKTGVTALRQKWREDVAPRISGTGQRAWLRMEQAMSSALERLASRANNVGGAIGSEVGRATRGAGQPAGRRNQSATGGADAPPTRSNESSEPSGALAP
jgi:hypothetical protein